MSHSVSLCKNGDVIPTYLLGTLGDNGPNSWVHCGPLTPLYQHKGAAKPADLDSWEFLLCTNNPAQCSRAAPPPLSRSPQGREHGKVREREHGHNVSMLQLFSAVGTALWNHRKQGTHYSSP
ncbi:hypothetical protein KIL84_022647 [Mauremys mutica]|uniref:Uncharacterized protein n=1 Tax=Mauremys mutica TaxID=74926 RepID=A0A9D4ANZ3_9SAUR|nr:hypothetical protein KIL84_022647 [Mauremys mutica]